MFAMTELTHRVFSQNYPEARERFLAAAHKAKLDTLSYAHPEAGRDGEQLATDTARLGPSDAASVLLVSSGCHGIEGFCGSGVQTALLNDGSFLAEAEQSRIAVLFVHALNPYGFSWGRRATHENVDLNRNFVSFSSPLPANRGYDELAHRIVPVEWPPSADNECALQAYSKKFGDRMLQAAICGGQYNHFEGIFFGGVQPTWSHQTLRHVLRAQGTHCKHLAWIDVHTGLGPSGVGERIAACRDDSTVLGRAKRWWGSKVTSLHDGSSSSALLEGLMWSVVHQECPQAEYTGIALEFGTVPLQEMIDAVRGEQWLHLHPWVDGSKARAIKVRMRNAFYTETDDWRRAVIAQGSEVAFQALRGLTRA